MSRKPANRTHVGEGANRDKSLCYDLGYEMNTPIAPLRTERLRIDPFTIDDVEGFFALYADPGVMRWLPVPALTTLEGARSLLQSYVDRVGAGAQFRWAIRTHESDQIIGSLKLDDPFSVERSSEVGYMLIKDAWGKGYASEAMGALLDHAFGDLGRHRVEALIFADNTPSRTLVERLGFRLEGYFVEHEWSEQEGRYLDDCIYGLLDREWTEGRLP